MDAIMHSDDGLADEENETNSYTNEIRSNGLAYPTYDTSSSSSSDDDEFGGNSYFRSKPLNPEEIKNHLKGNLSFGLPSKNKCDPVSTDNEISSPLGGILLRHLTQPKVDYIAKEIESSNVLKTQKEDIRMGYRLVRELMAPSLRNINSPFTSVIVNNSKCNAEMLEVTKKPMWLQKIIDNIINGVYDAIDEIVKDIRIILQNAYIFYGPSHSTSKKGIHLEYQLEKRLAALPEEMKDICTLEKTHGLKLNEEEIVQTKSSRICVKGEFFFSQLLYDVKGCKLAREKDHKMKRVDAMKRAKQEKEMKFLQWEELKFEEKYGTQIRAMWELPQIGQFLTICVFGLKIYAVSQYEIERMLLTPEHSVALRMIMTSLVSSPVQRLKIETKPYMPYRVWANKLASRVQQWYKAYRKDKLNATKVSEQLGIDPQFWEVCGHESPFQHSLFHELEFYKRVWLLKALCDFVAHSHKSIQDAILDQPEDSLREIVIGTDRDDCDYICFPHFINHNVRIYRRTNIRHDQQEEEEEVGPTEDQGATEMLDENVFSKEQIKYYKAVLKQSKRKLQTDDDWESRDVKKRKRSKSTRPKLPPVPVTPASPRTRPRNLRQRPTPRVLNIAQGSSEEDSDSSSQGNDDKTWTRGTVPRPVNDAENLPMKQITPRKKVKRKMHTCSVCEKSFAHISALNGHMAIHSKKRKSTGRRSARQSPVNDDCSNLLEDDTSNQETPVEGQVKTDDATEAPEPDDEAIARPSAEDDSVPKVEVKSEADCKTEPPVDAKDGIKVEQDTNTPDEGAPHATTREEKVSKMLEEENAKEELALKAESTDINVERDPARSVESSETATDINVEPDPARSVESPETGTDSIPVNGGEPDPESVTDHSEQIVWKFSDAKQFELVASSVEGLRRLIKTFGAVPSKLHKESKEGTNDQVENGDHQELVKDEETTDVNKDLPACEAALYEQLCTLLAEYAPYESKLKLLQKQIIRKMYKEEVEWKTKTSIYGDPDEEAWKSETELEPEPAPETPKVSSSSSSSADEFYDDGARKRKLRKRKCRAAAPSQCASLSASREGTPVPSPLSEDSEKITVSSRGRVRKLKKIVNYDKLDFEKLAEEASSVASLEREQKKKKQEDCLLEEEEVRVANHFKIPAASVQRYIMSKTGDVVGYVDTSGQTHHTSRSSQQQKPPKVQQPRAPPAVTPLEAAVASTRPRPISAATNAAPARIPVMAVAAKTADGRVVMMRVAGQPALTFMAKIKSGTPTAQIITVTHANQQFTFPHNSKYYTRHIPGFADCDIPGSPPKPSGATAVTAVQPVVTTAAASRTTTACPVAAASRTAGVTSAIASCGPVAASSVASTSSAVVGPNSSRMIMFKTPKGAVPVNVSTSLASMLEKRQVPKAAAGPSSAGVGGSNCQQSTQAMNSVKIYKAPIASNAIGSAAPAGRYVIVNQPQQPRQAANIVQQPRQAANIVQQPHTTNNFIQINNNPNQQPSQYIQIQQAPSVVQYSQASGQPTVVQVMPRGVPATATGSHHQQPTYVPMASAGLPTSPTYAIRTAPVYNQVIVQSPSSVQVQAAGQPMLIPQTLQTAGTQQLILSPGPPQATAQPVLMTGATQQMVTAAPPAEAARGTSKIFVIQTNEGRKVCLQTAEGKLALLSDEQVRVLNNSGTLSSNVT